ncbi:MAG: thioredoxin family protein [Actinobacteria bacterium]|nr:thioredoxin family protein [Actinomycetota bacterium]MCG2798386.1 thioredoxin family protein [Cellulomonas sp.]
MRSLLLVVAVLAVASAFGVWWRARQGRVRAVSDEGVLVPADLGADLGEQATFVQLSSQVCAACRSTARVLGGLAAQQPGVAHVELDVADHLPLVRRFDVMRTPTTLVLDARGAVVARLSGAVDPRQAGAALEQAAPSACTDGALAR